jgi:hypothetical protein
MIYIKEGFDMSNEFVKEWLQWAVDFIQTDISKSSLREKHAFFKRFNWFVSRDLFDTSFDPFGQWPQYSVNQILQFETSALKIQAILKRFIDEMTIHNSYPLPDIAMFIRPEGLWPPAPKNHRVYFKMNFHPKDSTPENWAILNLSRLLQGLEMHVIGKCKECRRHFLNFSLREKIYCTPRCASKSLARSRKERWGPKKYASYLKKQNKRMRTRYEKKQAVKGKKVKRRAKISVVKNVVT